MRRTDPDSAMPLGHGLPRVNTSSGSQATPKSKKYIAYGLPHQRAGNSFPTIGPNAEMYDEPIGSAISFLDFEGAVLFAGAFDKIQEDGFNRTEFESQAPADLDRREKEFYTLLERGKIIIFLISEIPNSVGSRAVPPRIDLFRRVADAFGIEWESQNRPDHLGHASAPEFNDYLARHGTAYVRFKWPDRLQSDITPLFGRVRGMFGGTIRNQIFFVPCTLSQEHDQILSAAMLALEAATKFRNRLSTAMPEWVSDYSFARELAIRVEISELRRQLLGLDGNLQRYSQFKRILCLQSDPLVEAVVRLVDDVFDVKLQVDDKKIDDALLHDNDGKIDAVFEIKGVNGNFKRENVNQLDSHRERLNLPPSVPGILIMNTMMSASSLDAKDERPHPDVVAKAVAENVLLIRTIDLLRYADAVEKQILIKESFRDKLLNSVGWLKVANDTVEVISD